MKFNVNALLSDNNVLRAVSVISILNLMGYVMLRNIDAVAFFMMVGFLSTFFSKNMIVVLLIAMVSTNFFVAFKIIPHTINEGMKGARKSTRKIKDNKGHDAKGHDAKGHDTKEEDNTKEDDDDSVADDSVTSGEIESSGRPGKLDDTATFEAAHTNLQDMLGEDAVKKMSKDTQALMVKQQGLQNSLKSLLPAVNESMATLEKIGGMDNLNNMIDKVSSVMKTFGGIGKREKSKQ